MFIHTHKYVIIYLKSKQENLSLFFKILVPFTWTSVGQSCIKVVLQYLQRGVSYLIEL